MFGGADASRLPGPSAPPGAVALGQIATILQLPKEAVRATVAAEH
jgi:hypothetical protein